MLTRTDILTPLVAAFEKIDYAVSLWEQGAASFDRVDQWSDIDLMLVVDDDKVEDALKDIERIVSEISAIDIKFRLPEPTWHGHSQLFIRIKDASPFLFIDICVMKKSSADKYLQYSIHNPPVVYFDKLGLAKDESPTPEEHLAKIVKRIDQLKTTFALFRIETIKELNRGNNLEAFAFYMGSTFRPLVEALRIKHIPWRYNFHTRYIHYELPKEIIDRLQKLMYISTPEDLKTAHGDAEIWFWETIDSINVDELREKLISTKL